LIFPFVILVHALIGCTRLRDGLITKTHYDVDECMALLHRLRLEWTEPGGAARMDRDF